MIKIISLLLVLYTVASDIRALAATLDNIDDVVEAERSAGASAYPRAPTPDRLRPAVNSIPQSLPAALKCFTCIDCPNVFPNTTVKLCPYTSDTTKRNKCVIYSEKYHYMKKPWYIRGCASERGLCTEIKKAHSDQDLVNLLTCHECVGDKCNSSSVSRSLPDLTMAFFVLVLIPVLAKYTLA